MLEKMADFFENRLDEYDEHMMTNIEAADEFYPFTAKQLLTAENCNILDLGQAKGLYFLQFLDKSRFALHFQQVYWPHPIHRNFVSLHFLK